MLVGRLTVWTTRRRVRTGCYIISNVAVRGEEYSMGLMDGIKKTVDNVSDALSEAGHKTNAEAEHASRDVAGDAMTPGEKLGSVANEGKENLLGGVDRAKRDVRENT